MLLRDDPMKAAVYESYGSPDVLQIADVDRPSIDKDEVLVQVHASSVTQGDRRLRAADYPGFLSVFGRLVSGVFGPRHAVPGSNFAGVVVAIGDEVARFEEGDEVFGGCMHGAHAEFLAVSQDAAIAEMPPNISFDEAADLAYGAGTALDFLADKADLQSGERVAIIGAAGGVGYYAVQVAKHLGANVTAVCRGDDFGFVRGLGANHLVDFTKEDFTDVEDRYDVIFDTSGTIAFSDCKNALSSDGRFLSLHMSGRLLLHMAATSVTGGPRAITGVATETQELLNRVRDLVASDAIRPIIDRRFSLDEIADAHRHLEAGRPRGSVVIAMVEPR